MTEQTTKRSNALSAESRAILARSEEEEQKGNWDYTATEEYISAEQELAVLADHDEACSWTLKANASEVRDHLYAVADGGASEAERTYCYALSNEEWARETREAMADERSGNGESSGWVGPWEE